MGSVAAFEDQIRFRVEGRALGKQPFEDGSWISRFQQGPVIAAKDAVKKQVDGSLEPNGNAVFGNFCTGPRGDDRAAAGRKNLRAALQ